MGKKLLILFILVAFISCSEKKKDDVIEDATLGFIEADVNSEETDFKYRAEYSLNRPGDGNKLERSFENAPPLIPHTTSGFFPIKIDRNICKSCHMPEKAEEVKAVPLPETHMSNIRPRLVFVDGIYQNPKEGVIVEKLKNLNNAYFNCSQCHTPQTDVKVDITNLFTPEFRQEFGLSNSDLIERIAEGI